MEIDNEAPNNKLQAPSAKTSTYAKHLGITSQRSCS